MLDLKFVNSALHFLAFEPLCEIIICFVPEESVVFIPEHGSATVFCLVVVTQAASLRSFVYILPFN